MHFKFKREEERIRRRREMGDKYEEEEKKKEDEEAKEAKEGKEAKEDKVQMRLVRALHELSYEARRLGEEEDRLCPEDRV